jgi:SAM-dependent methyltransferase
MNSLRILVHNLRQLSARRMADIEHELRERADRHEQALDTRLEEKVVHLKAEVDEHVERRSTDAERRMDERSQALDLRLDDRFRQMELKSDERFETVERRLDSRLEAHERRTDKYMLQSRTDIVDRTDVMLQLFEQRLDEQRREIRALREALARQHANAETATSNGFDPEPPTPMNAANLAQQPPARQIQSFRKLAESLGVRARPSLQPADATLYEKILDWKKVAQAGLSEFTPDEQEVADYILSFVGEAGERHYILQHMRRFIGTLQRIPPPARTTDRLLELGSLLHLAPAIKKFSGYAEVAVGDFWDSEQKVSAETLVQQTGGAEAHTFALHNFNVERDPFPFPDGHFRAVLCCELIEHLQSDPLHMLWECNRVLQPDGFLLLTTPNITSARALEGVLIGCTPYLMSQYNRQTPVDQHNREYAPYEIGIALAAAGFTVVDLETEDVWARSNPAILELLKEVNLPTDKRGDNIFALARKTAAPLERYPKEFYID